MRCKRSGAPGCRWKEFQLKKNMFIMHEEEGGMAVMEEEGRGLVCIGKRNRAGTPQ